MKHAKGNDTFFGFCSIKDYTQTLFSFNYISLVGFVSLLGGINGFITKYIYDTPVAIYTLVSLIMMDTLTGALRAIKSGHFTSKRFSRFLLILFSYIMLLAISFNLAKSTILFVWLPSFLYFGFCSVLLISLLENLTELNAIPKKLADKIKKIIDSKEPNI